MDINIGLGLSISSLTNILTCWFIRELQVFNCPVSVQQGGIGNFGLRHAQYRQRQFWHTTEYDVVRLLMDSMTIGGVARHLYKREELRPVSVLYTAVDCQHIVHGTTYSLQNRNTSRPVWCGPGIFAPEYKLHLFNQLFFKLGTLIRT